MASKSELLILLKLQDQASAGLGKVQGQASKLGSVLKTGAIAGGVALAGLGTASVKMAMDFEKSFAEVKTLLPSLSEEAFGKLQDDLIAFSKEMGIATNESVPALYQAISAGVPPENVIEFMTTASKAAIGGVTDLETAVDGISSVVNAYGADVLSAAEAADIMFTGVRLGKTNFEELSASLFQVVPTAVSLGVSFEEVTGSLAALTAQGVPTSVATTNLRQAFVEASKSGTKLDAAIRELSGKGFGDLIKEGQTSQQIFEDLRQSMPEQDFRDLFSSIEAMNAILPLTGEGFDSAAAAIEEARNAAGATDAAFKTISETASFQFNKAINNLKITLMEVGLKILPYITKALEVLVPWLEKNLPIAMKKTEQVFKDVWAAVEPFVMGAKELARNILPPVIDAFKKLAGFLRDHKSLVYGVITGWVAFKALQVAQTVVQMAIMIKTKLIPALLAMRTNVRLLVGATGLGLLIVAATLIYEYWDEIVALFERFGPKVIAALQGVLQFFKDFPENVKQFFLALPEWLKTHWKELLITALTGIPGLLFYKFRDELAAQWDAKVRPFFTDTIPTWLKDNWKTILIVALTGVAPYALWSFREELAVQWDAKVRPFFTDTIPTWLQTRWKEVLIAVFGGIPAILFITFRNQADLAWETIKSFFTDTIPTWFRENWKDTLVAVFGGIPLFLITKFRDKLWEALQSIAGAVTGYANEVVVWYMTGLLTLLTEVYNLGKKIPEWMWEGIKAMKDWLLSKAREFVSDLIGILDPRNWDFPGLSPMPEAMRHAGELAAANFAAGLGSIPMPGFSIQGLTYSSPQAIGTVPSSAPASGNTYHYHYDPHFDGPLLGDRRQAEEIGRRMDPWLRRRVK